MTSISGTESPPQHLITEPLCSSFLPKTLDNGDIRMAIAKAGQHAYNLWGDEATLTEDFLSSDFKTWEGGEASINHEPNHSWVKATMYDLVYDSETQLVIASFSGIPDWLKSLIYSADYRGVSQECVPMKYAKNSMNVIRGFGTGATFVTDPYEPAATQADGVGIPPALAAILASKYPQKIDDNMVDKTGGGTVPAISEEAFLSVVSEKESLKSQINTLETEKKKLSDEIVSWERKYKELESGEANRTKIAVESALANYDAELKSKAERETAVSELESVMGKEAAGNYLSTNPTIEQIKSIAGFMKSSFAKGVGTSQSSQPNSEAAEAAEAEEAWKSSHVRL